jgi:glc operon protein GlcG
MNRWKLISLIAIGLGFGQLAVGQTVERPSLSLAGARQVIAGAMSRATESKAPGGAFAVVDAGGNLMALERLDGTFAASANIAIGKARTAALFQRPTKVLEGIVNQGRTSMVALPDFTPLQGGVPVLIDGQIVGAIGVSGAASADEDEELAQAGAAVFAAMDAEVPATMTSSPSSGSSLNGALVRFDGKLVEQAFAAGMPLLETAGFKIHASRRTEPGMAEVHADETDIAYVVSGTATLVTGGAVVDPKPVSSGETRGASIAGGQFTQLSAGDVFVVPAGTPHWFQKVEGPFLYFVVKPISSSAGKTP